jgi:hypothetical protein
MSSCSFFRQASVATTFRSGSQPSTASHHRSGAIPESPQFSHGCVVEGAAFISRNGLISATIFAEFTAHPSGTVSRSRRWNDVMNKQSNGAFGIIIGGVVAVIAAIFILTGGELGGKKTVEGDQDLPPVTTTDK